MEENNLALNVNFFYSIHKIMSRRKGRLHEKRDFLQINANFDTKPFNWEHLNQNSRDQIIQMCLVLKIPINTESMSKRDLIVSLRQYPKMISGSNSPPPFMNSSRLQKYEYPALQDSHNRSNKQKSYESTEPQDSDETSASSETTTTTEEEQITNTEDILFRTEISLHGSFSSHLWRFILRKKIQGINNLGSTLFFMYVIVVFAAIFYFIFEPESTNIETPN